MPLSTLELQFCVLFCAVTGNSPASTRVSANASHLRSRKMRFSPQISRSGLALSGRYYSPRKSQLVGSGTPTIKAGFRSLCREGRGRRFWRGGSGGRCGRGRGRERFCRWLVLSAKKFVGQIVAIDFKIRGHVAENRTESPHTELFVRGDGDVVFGSLLPGG